MYGEYYILILRFYINIGIVYEDNNDYKKAYEYFKKWVRVSEEILGLDYLKIQCVKGVLREMRYKRIVNSLGEFGEGEVLDNIEVDLNEDIDENLEEFERVDVENFQFIYLDLERYCEDDVEVVNEVFNLNNSSSSVSIERENNINDIGILFLNLDRNEEENFQVLMNGYFFELLINLSSEDESEDMYDDQFELYVEDYVFNVVSDFVIDEFNVNLDDSDDDDEIVQFVVYEINVGDVEYVAERDNRYEDRWEGYESSSFESEIVLLDLNRQLIRDRN